MDWAYCAGPLRADRKWLYQLDSLSRMAVTLQVWPKRNLKSQCATANNRSLQGPSISTTSSRHGASPSHQLQSLLGVLDVGEIESIDKKQLQADPGAATRINDHGMTLLHCVCSL